MNNNNDINLFIQFFSSAEAIRQKLGQQYQIRSEINYKVRSIRRQIEESDSEIAKQFA